MRLPWNRHPQDAELARMADELLEGDRSVQIRSHLASCGKCAARLDAHLRIVRALTGDWKEMPATQSAGVRSKPYGLLVPAGAGALVLVAALIWRGMPVGPTGEATELPSEVTSESPTATATHTPGKSGQFVATGSMLSNRGGHTATLLQDGRVLIAGGGDGTTVVDTAELYDPRTGEFTETGRMSGPQWGGTAILLRDGRVLIVGGTNGSDKLPYPELYDPATGTFTRAASMNQARFGAAVALLQDGRVLVAGGASESDLPNGLRSAELYDPETGAWSYTGSLPEPVDCPAVTAVTLDDGRVLIAACASDSHEALADKPAELYEPKTGTFQMTGSMITGRSGAVVTKLANGKVLVAGGLSALYTESSAELYDPGTGSFTKTGSMVSPGSDGVGVLLADGRVLIVGGVRYDIVSMSDAGAPLPELYDPESGTFTQTAPLLTPRFCPGLTLLQDGRVLVTGGTLQEGNSATRPLSSAELYNP